MVKVAVASSAPLLVHRCRRACRWSLPCESTPVIVPPVSDGGAPSSTALGSLAAIWAGVADAGQIVQGHPDPSPVVNDQTRSLASALPATSMTPCLPPVIVAV